MAKLTAPCLSLTATGKLAKTLVFATWKGIKYARQYVTPANPNSANQQTQRGFITSAMALWHDVAAALNVLDLANLNREAQNSYTPMSGCNAYTKNYVNTRVLGVTPLQLYATAEISKAAGAISIEATSVESTVNVKLRWGFSPTTMLNLVTRTQGAVAGTTHTFAITTTTEGQVIYYQIYDLTALSQVTIGIGRLVTEA